LQNYLENSYLQLFTNHLLMSDHRLFIYQFEYIKDRVYYIILVIII